MTEGPNRPEIREEREERLLIALGCWEEARREEAKIERALLLGTSSFAAHFVLGRCA